MERLPQEIYDSIAQYVQFLERRATNVGVINRHQLPSSEATPRSRLSRLAPLSRPWRVAIEKLSFAALRITSNELVDFEKLVHGSRRRYLRSLRFNIILPNYEDVKDQFERESDRQANDEVFTTALVDLFKVLGSWDPTTDGVLHLDIDEPRSLSDKQRGQKRREHLNPLPLPVQEQPESSSSRDLEDRRYRHSYLRLVRPQDLVSVTVVESFTMGAITGHSWGRRFAPRVSSDLAGKLPNIRSASWAVHDLSRGYPTLRRSLRREFAQSLLANLSANTKLETLSLLSCGGEFLNGRWPPPDLGDTDETGRHFDPFSVAIREATGQLTTIKHLTLAGTFDASLFWPTSIQSTIVSPFW